MSQPIMSSSLSNPVAGATGYMDWSGNGLPVTGGRPAQILLQNESGCGLRVKLRGSGRGFDFPAGAWMQGPMPLQPNETGLDYTILYVLPNQPVGLLLGTYYAPGEVAVGVSLGNSPIGLSGTVSATVEQIINDDKPSGTQVVEARPSGQSSSYVVLTNDGDLTLHGALSTDNGALASDGSGNLQTTGALGTTTTEAGAHLWKLFTRIAGIGNDNAFSIYDSTSGITALTLDTAGKCTIGAALASVAGVATAGPYGVPLNTDNGKDINVTSTALATIATVTIPNDGANHDIIALGQLYVGAANTNNGIVTLQIAYTDPHQGALTVFFNVYGQNNLINGITQAKGVGIQTDPRHIRCEPNTAVTISYKNTAAGTISDYASGSVVMVN